MAKDLKAYAWQLSKEATRAQADAVGSDNPRAAHAKAARAHQTAADAFRAIGLSSRVRIHEKAAQREIVMAEQRENADWRGGRVERYR